MNNLFIESLESRALLSSTNVFQTYPGFYEVDVTSTGTGVADQVNIQVDQTADTMAVSSPGGPVATYYNVQNVVVKNIENGNGLNVVVGSTDMYGLIGTTIYGSAETDYLTARSISATIYGGSGNCYATLDNSYRGSFVGGNGYDTVNVTNYCFEASIRVGVQGGVVNAAGFTNPNGTDGISIYGGAGPNFIVGTPYNDVIYGGNSRDKIHAGGGDDWIYSLGGTVDGGPGNDVAYVPTGVYTYVYNVETINYY